MFCSNCGTERSGGNYCSSCGTKFEAIKAKSKLEPKITQQETTPIEVQKVDGVQSDPPQMTPGTKKGLTIGAVLLGVLLIIVVAVSSNASKEKAKIEASASASASAQQAADEQAAKDAAAELVRQQNELKRADNQACTAVKAYVRDHTPSSVASYQEGALVLSDLSTQIRNLVAGTNFVQAAGIAYANALADAATGLQAGLPLTATGKGVIDQTRINFDNACKAL